MRLDFCVACGTREVGILEHHHLVPRSAGGSDEDGNVVTLCHACHGKAHGYDRQNVRKLTKEGLAAAKARGTKLGGTRWDQLAGEAGRRGRDAGLIKPRATASARAVDLAAILADVQAGGAASLREIAAGLNEREVPAARGGMWSATQVRRILH